MVLWKLRDSGIILLLSRYGEKYELRLKSLAICIDLSKIVYWEAR